jgi:hypothetical protein
VGGGGATYLASVLTPCLVTALAIGREQSARIAGMLLARQAVTALVATGLLVRTVTTLHP